MVMTPHLQKEINDTKMEEQKTTTHVRGKFVESNTWQKEAPKLCSVSTTELTQTHAPSTTTLASHI